MVRTSLPIGILLAVLLVFPAPESVRAEEDAAPSEGLAIVGSLASAEVTSGAVVRFRATFRNDGSAPIAIHLPRHLGSIVFPSWVLTDEAGDEWMPRESPFQSMWKTGLQGEILELAPGAARVFEVSRAHFVRPRDRGSPSLDDGLALPPGRYRVVARHAQADTTVPWSDRAFETYPKDHPGLWTGEARSAAVELVVHPSDRLVLRLDAPEEARAGAPYPLRLELHNPTGETLDLRTALVVTVSSKAYGSGTARFLVRESDVRPAAPPAVDALRLEPGASRVVEVDLMAASFGETSGRSARYRGMTDFLRVGLFRLTARLVDGAAKPVAAVSAWRTLQGPGLVEDGPLRLALEPGPTRGPGWPVVVVLRNEGEAPVRVPAQLSFPRHVFFSLVRPGREAGAQVRIESTASAELPSGLDALGGRAVIAAPLAWNGDTFERARPYDADSIVVLAPGAEIRRMFDVRRLVRPDPARGDGVYHLRAFWRNLENGARLGHDPRLFTGLLRSGPLDLGGTRR